MTNYAPISDYFTPTSTPSHLHYPLPSPMIYSLDLIGLFGPIILALFSLWQLWNNGIYWYVYIITFIVNTVINKSLKIQIREPRPTGSEPMFISEPYSGIEQYGMPSGHAQSVLCSTTYLYLVKHSPLMFLGEMFIVALTVYQRWKYRQHSIKQLYMGAIIGMLVAYISYSITTMWVTGQL